MFQHLLVPLDGSRLAEAILAPTRVLAARLGATVTLLHVLERRPPAQVHGQPHLGTLAEAGAYLGAIARELAAEGIVVQHHAHEVAEGSVALSITRHAAELGVDLIMLCTHGQGDVRQNLFGTIAQTVIGMGATPVFIVHPETAPAALTGGRFVVPLDGATDHESSLPVAAAMARACGAGVTLLTAVPKWSDLGGPRAAVGRLLPSATEAFLEVQQAEMRQYLDSLAARMQAEDLQVTYQLERGEPVPVLVKALQDTGADLLIMSTHARRGWSAFWSGSVGPALLSQWRRPALLVRASGQGA